MGRLFMAKKVLFTNNAPAAIGPYSQAIESGGFVFCSGQIPINPATGEVVQGDIKVEAEQVMKNISAVLKNADLQFSNVVKTTIFLTSMSDFAAVNEIYGKYFPTEPPARSTIAVKELPKNVKVEIEVIARKG
jgi:2-iminobutanoate/2-iminopropanoate deaminase